MAGAYSVTMRGTTLPTPLYLICQEKLGLSALMITVIFAVYAARVPAALLLFGRGSDALGRRRVLLPGLALRGAVGRRVPARPRPAAAVRRCCSWGRVLSGLSAGIFTGTTAGLRSMLVIATLGGGAALALHSSGR